MSEYEILSFLCSKIYNKADIFVNIDNKLAKLQFLPRAKKF